MSETSSDLSTDLATTPRLYVGEYFSGPLAAGVQISLPPAASHYLAGVMRRIPGDMVRVFDGVHGEWAARVSSVAKKKVELVAQVQSAPQEVTADLWLCVAPLKRGRIDWVVEKACELGVARLLPMITQRTIVDKLNIERLQAHMVEAAEQCGRTSVPRLDSPIKLAALLQSWQPERRLIFADEMGGAPMADALRNVPAPAGILIGPEGGFTHEEREMICAMPQALPVSLGPRILRADTAAAVAVAVWQVLGGAAPPR